MVAFERILGVPVSLCHIVSRARPSRQVCSTATKNRVAKERKYIRAALLIIVVRVALTEYRGVRLAVLSFQNNIS